MDNMDKFNIGDWQFNRLLKENKGYDKIDMNGLKSIYQFILNSLTSPAESAGLRMSIFEQEFPTPSSFMMAYDKETSDSNLNEGINDNIEKIDITHTYQDGNIYKIQVWVDGKEMRPSEEELNNLISSAIGSEVQIPNYYNPEEFKSISNQLQDKGIEVVYDDTMDIS